MTAQQKREQPEYEGKSQKDKPEMPAKAPVRPEMTGRDKPGTMPENPGNVDREHEPAGLEPGESRLEKPNQQRRKD